MKNNMREMKSNREGRKALREGAGGFHVAFRVALVLLCTQCQFQLRASEQPEAWEITRDYFIADEKAEVLRIKKEFEAYFAFQNHCVDPRFSERFNELLQSYKACVDYGGWKAALADKYPAASQELSVLVRNYLHEKEECERLQLSIPFIKTLGNIPPIGSEMGLRTGSFRKGAEEERLRGEVRPFKDRFYTMKARLPALQKGFLKWNLAPEPLLQVIQKLRDYRDYPHWDRVCARTVSIRYEAKSELDHLSDSIVKGMEQCEALILAAEQKAEAEWARAHPEEAAQKRQRMLLARAEAAERRAAQAEAAAQFAYEEMNRRQEEQNRRIEEARQQAMAAEAEAERAARKARKLQQQHEFDESLRRSRTPPSVYGW